MRKFTLYWSSLSTFENCPQKFLWGRGWGNIDCGGGPGKRKPKPLRDSRHHAVMGIVIQAVIEDLYNNELWRHPQGLQDQLLKKVDKEFSYQVSKPRNWIDYRIMPKAEMLRTCREGVLGFLKTMKAQKLLGPYAKAEVDLVGYIDKYNPVGGRADTIIKRPDTGITIIDGKNGKHKGKYTDPDQLRWYALLFYLAYGSMPDRLGFVYYRFPYDLETGETGIEWVEFTKDDLKGLAKRAVDARKKMNKEKFPANPSPSGCRFCDYETVCEARLAQKQSNRRKGRVSPDDLISGEGFVDLDL